MGNPKGPNRSWKKDQNKDQPDAAGKRSWQHGGASEPVASSSSRRLLVRILAFISLIVVVGVITFVLLKLGGTDKHTLILVAHDEPTSLNMPANVFGAQNEVDLESWARQSRDTSNIVIPPDTQWKRKEQSSKDWLDWLIAEGKKAGNIVIYYFSMPGHADAELGPYLWLVPGEASHPEPKHRLFLRDILDKVPSELKGKKILFIFDASQVDHSILHGMVTTDFARGLKSLEEKLSAIPNCYILNSCSENQLSWTSPELGKSIFSHYLCQGLRGAARQSGDRPKISIKNLFDYVSIHTEKWSQANRSALQKPMLLPTKQHDAADAIEVATVPRDIPPEAEPRQRDTLLDVKGDWEKYYQLAQLAPSPEVIAPYQWKSYTALLLRLEKLYFAGAASKNLEAIRRQLEVLNNFIVEQSKSQAWSSYPLIQDVSAADARTREKDSTLAKASTILNVLWKSDNPATIKEDVKKWKEMVASTKDNSALRRQLTIHSWRWTMEKVTAEPDLTAAERVLDLIEEELRPSHRPADVHFVRMLVRDTQEKPWALVRTKTDLIKLAITTRTQAERIAWLGSDVIGTNYASHWVQMNRWIAPMIKSADELRRSGEDLLFDAHASQWLKAQELLTQASNLYLQASTRTKTLIEACQLRDQLYYQLPCFSDWAAYQSGPLLEQTLQAWSNLHQLARMLQAETSLDDKLINNHALALRKQISELQTAWMKQVKQEVRTPSVGTAQAFHDLEKLLQLPFFADGFEGNALADRAKSAREDRLVLLRKLKDTSYRLFTNSQQPGKIQESTALYRPDDFADARLRLAHARLGDDAIQLIKSANVTPVVLNFSVDRRNSPQEQVSNLMQVSSKLGTYWSVLPLVLQQSDEAKAAYELMHSTGTASTINRAEKWMTQAAQLNRQIDAGTSEPLHKSNQLNATQIERAFSTHRFLLGQSARSQDEGWADLQPNESDYSTKLATLYLGYAEELLGNLAREKSVEAKDKGWHALIVEARIRLAIPPGKLQLTFDTRPVPKQLFVTDEPYVKFAVGMKSISTPLTGYPIIRLWSPPGSDGTSTFTLNDKMVADFKSHYSKPMPAADIPLDETLLWKNSQADQELTAQKSTQLPLKAMLLHRGHLYDNADIQVSMLTPPRMRWVKEAPSRNQGIVVFGDDRLRDGHLHIMFDTTHSMVGKVKGQSMTKIDAARQALEEVLFSLPSDITVSISAFRGIENKKEIAANRMILPPTRWDDKNKYIPRIMESLPTEATMNKEYQDGIRTVTPISRGINEILFQNPRDPIFPIDENKPFTLLLLTDGAESEESANTADSLRDDLLRRKHRQLVLHILLFSLDEATGDKDEIRRMKEMDAINTEGYKRTFINKGLTPPRVWPGMDSVEILTSSVKNTLKNKFTVLQNGEPLTDASDQRVSVESEANWNRVPLKIPNDLEAMNYEVFTAGMLQKFKLQRGDRLAMKIDRQGLNTQLIIPSIANLDPALPDQLKRKSGNVQMAMLSQQISSVSGGGHALQLLPLMEQPVLRTSRDTTLVRQRPKFAWFQLAPLLNEGGSANSNNINIVITEKVHDIASMWSVEASPWPAKQVSASPLTSPAGYRLESYWVNNSAEPLTGQGIDLANPTGNPGAINTSGSVSITGGRLLDLWNRKRGNSEWLYVRCSYQPDNPVLIQLRPRSSLPGFTPRTVAEEHRFYLQANTVSAWFELSSLLQERELTLDIYSLKDVIQQADPNAIKFEYEVNEVTKQPSRLPSRSWNRD